MIAILEAGPYFDEIEKAGGYEVIVEPNDKIMESEPPYPFRMAFCRGPLGEEIEFFCERQA